VLGERRADGFQSGPALCVEAGARADELEVVSGEQAALCRIERRRRAIGEHGIHAGEQRRIRPQFGGMPGEDGGEIPFDGGHGRFGECRGELLECLRHPLEIAAGTLQRQNRVFERRRRGVGGNRGELCPMNREGALEGRRERPDRHVTERRRAERGEPGLEKDRHGRDQTLSVDWTNQPFCSARSTISSSPRSMTMQSPSQFSMRS
jgi:hypothetical protein